MAETEIKSINGRTLCDNTARETIPKKVSQLTNDAGYLTSIPSEYVTESELTAKKYLTSVPSEYITETELNAKGYLTQHQDLSSYAKKTEVPTKVSQLTNDSGYLTAVPSEYVTETELTAKKYLTSVPSEYVTDSELTAKGYATQASVTQLSEEIANLGGVTDYVVTEAETVADLILEKMNANCLVGAFVTDIHLERNQTATETAIKHAGMGINEIRKLTPLDFVANLGDNCESEDSHKFIYKSLYNAILGTDSFWLRGNHDGSAYNFSDDTGYEYLVTDDEVYKFIGAKNKGHVINADDRKGMYGYKDYEDLRLRIIYLNTSEVFENSISSSTANVIMSATQINWLQNTALDFTGKTDIDKWKVLVLSHTPLDWNTSTQQAVTVLDNYASSGSGAKIIGNIHGHVHNCNVGTIGTSKIARIAIPQVCADRYNEYSSSGSSYAKWGEFAEDGTTPIYYYKGTGNATDTMFCVVVIDCENEKFYAITFGATTASTSDGSYTKNVRIREVSFDGTGTEEPDEPVEPDVPTPAYTNQIPLSVTSSGAEYVGHNGEDGYSAGYRVNSSGNEVQQSGMCCTGYIPVEDNTVRLKNITVSGTSTSYFVFYYQDKTYHQVKPLTDVLKDVGGGVYEGTLTYKGWIRISCGVIDDTTILTLDEEITD